MSLTYKDVAEILRIVDESDVEELILELADSKLTIRRNAATGGRATEKPTAIQEPVTTAVPDSMPEAAPEFASESTPEFTPEPVSEFTPEPIPASTPEPEQTPAPAPEFSLALAPDPELKPEPYLGSAPDAAPAPVSEAIPEGATEVRAPMVGTFYRRPGPQDQPFVSVGDHVEAGDPLCLIEVMKLFTTMEAQEAGRVVQIAAENEALVQLDQLLFVIQPD